MRLLALFCFYGCLLSACSGRQGSPAAAGAPAPPPSPSPTPWVSAVGPDGLPSSAMELLTASQDASCDLDFERSEALALEAVRQYPEHPLPRIFLQAAVLAQLQESDESGLKDEKLVRRFERETAAALRVARQREAAAPDARSQLYLGCCLGVRGLVKMQSGHFLRAYYDGQDAAQSLRLALSRDPGLYEADLGLGQYDYFCGRMAGPLRFVAGLKGDVRAGISRLEACASRGGCAGTSARLALARIYSLEETDFAKALPYVRELRRRYPRNYSYVQYALATARGLGWQDPRSQALLEGISRQWDKGWRPPAHAKLALERARLELARAYLRQGRKSRALAQFRSLAASADASVAGAGRRGLEAALRNKGGQEGIQE